MKQDVNAIIAKIIDDADPELLKEAEAVVAADMALLKVAIELRASRKSAGLTQSQLAEKSGVTQSEISRIEKGRYSPRLATLFSLARALNKDFVITGTKDAVSKVA
jgi:DNA-binding XRE family transcriptional regulator